MKGKIIYFSKYGATLGNIINGKKYAVYCATMSRKRALNIAKKLKQMGIPAKMRIDPATKGEGRRNEYLVYVPLEFWHKIRKKRISGDEKTKASVSTKKKTHKRRKTTKRKTRKSKPKRDIFGFKVGNWL